MISNSGHDENGQYSGGAAGDQTGKEWSIIPWYNRPWNVVLRFEDPKTADTIAELATEAANNNNIGYDQGQRWTFWDALKASGYKPQNIKIKCEADCSAGVLAICKATGYLLHNSKMKAIDPNGYTGTERKILVNAGAKALTAAKYLTSDKYLKRGDILLYEGAHTAINLTDGSKVPVITTDYTFKPSTVLYGDYNNSVYLCQELLQVLGFYKLKLDKSAGWGTLDAVKSYQKSVGLPADSICGPNTWARLLKGIPASNGTFTLKTIQSGYNGPEALLLQEILKSRGVYSGDLDASYGKQTEAAVRTAQKSGKLSIDGVCGPATWASLIGI